MPADVEKFRRYVDRFDLSEAEGRTDHTNVGNRPGVCRPRLRTRTAAACYAQNAARAGNTSIESLKGAIAR